jgi:hypothetical protein
MTTCPNCDREVTDEKFCPSCGTALPSPIEAVTDDAVTDDLGTEDEVTVGSEPAAGSAKRAPADPADRADPADPGDARPSWTGSLVAQFVPARLLAPLAHAAIAYAVAWGFALVTLVLVVVAASDARPDASLAFFGAFQLVGLALGGTLTIGTTAVGVSASISIVWLPLLLTVVATGASIVLAARDEARTPSGTRALRVILAVAHGLVLAVLALVLAAVFPVAIAADGATSAGTSTVSGSSVSFGLFIGALLLGFLATFAARSIVRWRQTEAPASARFLSLFRAAAPAIGYAVAASVLFGLIALIGVAVQSGPTALLTAPLWLPTVALDSLAFVNLVPLSLTGEISALLAVSNTPTSFWLLNLAIVVFVGTIVGSRRAVRPVGAPSWLLPIAAFALLGVFVSVFGSALFWSNTDLGALGYLGSAIGAIATTSGAAGPAAFAFVVFAALGAVVEAVARFVAPTLVALLPSSVAGSRLFAARVHVPPVVVVADEADGAAPVLGSTDVVVVAAAPTSTAIPIAPVVLSPAKKKRILLIGALVGGLAVLAVLAIVAVSLVNQMVFGPQVKLESYLDHVVSHDATGALRIGDIDAPSSDRVLLTDEIVGKAESGITGYRILSSTSGADSADFQVELDQDGQKFETSYHFDKTGSTAVIFDEWSLATVELPALPISLDPSIESIVVNGSEIETGSLSTIGDGYVSLPVFPGRYTVGLGGDTKWFTAEPQSTTVTFASADSLALEVVASEQLSTEITGQLSAILADCAKQTVLEPEGCPFDTYSFGDNVRNVVWTVDEIPALDISHYGDEWIVSGDEYVTANVTYVTDPYFGEGETARESSDMFSIRGTIDFSSGDPKLVLE